MLNFCLVKYITVNSDTHPSICFWWKQQALWCYLKPVQMKLLSHCTEGIRLSKSRWCKQMLICDISSDVHSTLILTCMRKSVLTQKLASYDESCHCTLWNEECVADHISGNITENNDEMIGITFVSNGAIWAKQLLLILTTLWSKWFAGVLYVA